MWYMKFKSLEVIEMFSGALNKKKVLVRRHKYGGDSITPARRARTLSAGCK